MTTIKIDELDQNYAISEQDAAMVNGGTLTRSVRDDDYSGIVFSGGWGSSMYQYDFPGDY